MTASISSLERISSCHWSHRCGRQTHGKTSDLASLEQLANDEQRFHRLANAHVVGDQQPHDVLSQSHDQWHDLISPGSERQLGESPKRTCPVPEG